MAPDRGDLRGRDEQRGAGEPKVLGGSEEPKVGSDAGEPKVVWQPGAADHDRANLARFAAFLSSEVGVELSRWEQLREFSITRLADFWESVRRFYALDLHEPHSAVLEGQMPQCRWFPGGECNYAEEILSRAHRDAPAIIALDESAQPVAISIESLEGDVGALAAALTDLGVQAGDRVAGYLPNIPEAVIALLATASIGAIWSSCAPDFGPQSVIDRFAQIEPKVLIGVDGYLYAGRSHDRRTVLAEIERAVPSIQATIVVELLGGGEGALHSPSALRFAEITREPKQPRFKRLPFQHPLWILFSSGTTGLPKGILHSHGGILLEHLKALGLCLDLRPEDRYFFHSSTSWMAWNYLVGGLLHGASIVLYNGSPTHPDAGALWRLASQTEASVLGLGSAYVSGSQKAGLTLPAHRSLRILIPTGSPLPPSGWQWLARELEEAVRIDSILGGTDVCTAFFGGSPLLPVWEGEISARWLGVDAHAYGEQGEERIGEVGEFVIEQPMPSMPIALWGDEDGSRYRDTYFSMFPSVWRQGDWITITDRGSIIPSGRSDATLNRAGVRIGSAEIYAVVETIDGVQDSLVVGVELPDGEYYMPLFLTTKEGVSLDDQLRTTISALLRAKLSPRHVPDEIVHAPFIPRTLTGKKVEVPIKRILSGEPPERALVAGSVDRPEAIEWFVAFAKRRLPNTEQRGSGPQGSGPQGSGPQGSRSRGPGSRGPGSQASRPTRSGSQR